MLTLDISKSRIKNLNSLVLIRKVKKIHLKMLNKSAIGSEMMGWVDIVKNPNTEEIDKIIKQANLFHQENIKVLIVVGIGGSFLGAKAAIDFIKGQTESNKKVIFVGTNMSSDFYTQILNKIEKQKWGLCVISKSGNTLESAIGFRIFKKKLIDTYQEQWKKYLVVITDQKKGSLRKFVNLEKLISFPISENVGGRFSLLTPVGLFPMAFAGVNIKEIFKGALDSLEAYSSSDLLKNDAYKYATARWFLGKKRFSWVQKGAIQMPSKYLNYGWSPKVTKKRDFEILAVNDQDSFMLTEWWKQLYGESEGKNKKAIFPTSVLYSQDLHSLGQIIQEGNNNFFETFLLISSVNSNINIPIEKNDFDNLNYVAKKHSLNEINNLTYFAVEKAHRIDNKVPTITITMENKTEKSLGELVYFYFISVTMYCYLIGVNPFNQPGVEVYKKNILELL